LRVPFAKVLLFGVFNSKLMGIFLFLFLLFGLFFAFGGFGRWLWLFFTCWCCLL